MNFLPKVTKWCTNAEHDNGIRYCSRSLFGYRRTAGISLGHVSMDLPVIAGQGVKVLSPPKTSECPFFSFLSALATLYRHFFRPCNKLIILYSGRVTFVFKPSKKSNNGTDVNAGQLPQILYRLVAHDAPPSKQSASSTDNAHCISQRFSRMITPVRNKTNPFLAKNMLLYLRINQSYCTGLLPRASKLDPVGMVGSEDGNAKQQHFDRLRRNYS